MEIRKHWKTIVLVCLLVVLIVGVMRSVFPGPLKVSEAQLNSPDGKVMLEVWRRLGDDSFEWEYSKGPEWSGGRCSIQGVTEFRGGSFSPDSRHLILVFADANGKEQYFWTDYETSLTGGLPVESRCRSEDSFAAEIKKDGIWTDISLRFLGWHPKENRALFAYELTTPTDSKHSGYFWYDMEARYRYKENPAYVIELPLD